MFRVFVIDSSAVPHVGEIEVEWEVLRDCAAVELLHVGSEEEFAPYARLADGIILWHQFDLTATTIRLLDRARIIVRNGVGVENVDGRAAAGRGIPVANVPDYGTEEVADHAIALCLALTRQLRPLMTDVSQGNWRWETASACRRIRGQCFGIVGCGRIGMAVALRAKALGYAVRFYDPYVGPGYEKAIAVLRVRSLEELLANADIVSLHVPLTDETCHMINAAALKLMKPTAYLINTSRGPVVQEAALQEALASRSIAGAGLDVLEHEPHGLDLFNRHPNCIITPHSAFYSQESMVEMRRSSAVVVREVLMHHRLMNVVNGVATPPPASQEAETR
jgi:phosphoglycerate dehydrogenase-like enzyme